MAGITKQHSIMIWLIIGLVLSSYLFKVSSFFFSNKSNFGKQPVNYNILETTNNDSLLGEESDFISLSNEMIEIFDKNEFTINNFVEGKIKKMIIFSSLPDDFMEIEPIKLRKDLFIKSMIPIIFIENEKVLIDRKKILNWWTETDGEEIAKEFWPDWLISISDLYNFEGENIGDLLKRVDLIPISLALSQAVIESGWGTSRYARQGNAIFGQYTYDQDSGLIPEKREKKDNHLIKKFGSLNLSVRSYIKNLNTHSAYEGLRKKRRDLRMEGSQITGHKLLPFLYKYSERGNDYIKDLTKLIDENNFKKFDNVYLKKSNFVE